MKEMIDIHVVLATAEDMQQWEDDAEDVAERFNDMLHYLYNAADEDIEIGKLEQIIQHVWEYWSKDQHLIDIDAEDLYDWVDQLLATWDDGDSNSLDDDN
ncbi:hypothetical protein [Neptunicella sp. SCSIO 80796]|uniref:hypothetical protein n=1 Tax=Neptunicella plasticusilytica TaxID=3117012 RepID=UPI003A4E3E50